MYPVLVFLHIVSVFGFLMAHGVSAGVAFRLKTERNPDKVRALLELSAATYPVMYGSLLLLLVLGVVLGFMGSGWSRGWIWLSLILLVVIYIVMVRFGSRVYGEARRLSGLPYFDRGRPHPPIEPGTSVEINAVLDQGRPTLLTVSGFGSIVIIAWLMMFKPL
jgi:uncharacterized membrane protein